MTKEAMLQELVSRAAELLEPTKAIYFEDWARERDKWLQQLNYASTSHKLMIPTETEQNDH